MMAVQYRIAPVFLDIFALLRDDYMLQDRYLLTTHVAPHDSGHTPHRWDRIILIIIKILVVARHLVVCHIGIVCDIFIRWRILAYF